MTINEIRDYIKSKLDTAYAKAGRHPHILTTSLPVSQEGNKDLEKEAKAKGDNGVIFVGRGIRQYQQKVRSLYEVDDPYYILIYSNNKGDDSEINDLFDIARSCVGTFMNLQFDFVGDVKGYKSGLYVAWLQCTWRPIFQAGG
jgi:hypothetical protein